MKIRETIKRWREKLKKKRTLEKKIRRVKYCESCSISLTLQGVNPQVIKTNGKELILCELCSIIYYESY